MKQVINTGCKSKNEEANGLPIKMWLDDLESGAIDQAKNLARLPFAFKHIAIMPDAHHGYGMPIGGVLATVGQIIPNAVGVDIGCGMRAVQIPTDQLPARVELELIVNQIRTEVPVGFKKHSTRAHHSQMPSQNNNVLGGICMQEYSNAAKSLGTLGGGNHFIEIQKGEGDQLWVMVHSGSRNLGTKVANYYNGLAQRLNEHWNSSVPKSWELAHLPIDSKMGREYIDEMNYCVEFAKLNRKAIMDKVLNIIYRQCKFLDEDCLQAIDVAHNYARMEHHFGKDVMVHRKGATSAREGEVGIIPGSQGSSSFIVTGKGNPESFTSCSHGAGRRMSRSKAKKDLDLDAEIRHLDYLGVVHSVRTESDLDEAPSSYKNIYKVMDNQSDLVDIRTELRPLAVVKG